MTGCAERVDDTYSGNAHAESLAEWMRLHHAELLDNYHAQDVEVRPEGGFYVDLLSEGDLNAPGLTNEATEWVRYEWDERSLQGDILTTCDELLARQAGAYAPRTHYAPIYRPDTLLSPLRAPFLLGETYAAARGFSREVTLKAGTEAILYREGADTVSLPSIARLKIVEVVADPVVHESRTLETYAQGFEMLTPVDTLPPLYMDRTWVPTDADLLARFGSGTPGERVVETDNVYIWYVIRSLDGFVVETNIAEVKASAWGEKGSHDSWFSYQPSINKDRNLMFWYWIVTNARFGAWHAALLPSDYAYGAYGAEATETHAAVQGYESLRVEFYIEPKAEDGEDGEELVK